MRNFSLLSLGMSRIRAMSILSAVAVVLLLIPSSQAALVGTVPTPPGTTVFPGVPSTGSPGTLLATLNEPFSYATTAGTTSGNLISAVYRESGGTLDFYYQVDNNASSATAIARETDTSFAGFTVATGFRLDGGSLAGTGFVNGTEVYQTADLNAASTVVGFSFSPPPSSEILQGTQSVVLVVSTNATAYTAGNASVIDGGTQTVASFQPTTASTVPEPGSLLLIGAGLMGLAGISRFRR